MGVGGGLLLLLLLLDLLIPKVVKADELSENKMTKTVNKTVKLPH